MLVVRDQTAYYSGVLLLAAAGLLTAPAALAQSQQQKLNC